MKITSLEKQKSCQVNKLKMVRRMIILFAYTIFNPLAHANTIDVYLAAGQSNAKLTWADAIQSELNQLRPERKTVVVHSYHSGAWLNQWWNDGAKQNYTDNLAALSAKMIELEEAGDQPIFKGLFWFQGEGDSGSYSNMDIYKERFRAYINQLEEDTATDSIITVIHAIDGNSAPFYDDPANLAGRTRAQVEYMRNIHFELGDELHGFTVDTRPYQRGDAWHISSSELSALGEFTAEKLYLDELSGPYKLITSAIREVSDSMEIDFSGPSSIENWSLLTSQSLTNVFRQSQRGTYSIVESSAGNYTANFSITEGAKCEFFKLSSP